MIKFESEHDLEMMLYNHHSETKMCLVSEQEYSDCYRQFNTNGYGICDLIYVDKQESTDMPCIISIHVVELKNQGIKLADFAQLARYKTFFDRAISEMEEECLAVFDIKYSLVVPEGIINNNDACYLTNCLDDVFNVVEFKFNPLKGIVFNECSGFIKISEDLNCIKNIIEVVNHEG